ncbi:hypothetical protein REPUB_Repub01dG0226500 [Reevesia pubescens]
MGRTLILTCIMVLCFFTASVHSHYHSQTLPWVPKAAKVTNLHFFLHEILSGENATAVMVARANITNNANNSTVPLGCVAVLDDQIKIGSEHNSEVIGNAQGLAVSPSRNGATVVVYLDFGFTKGEFNGSSISVFSRNLVTETERELAVVGGRGKFRMATGFALLKTYFLNQTNLIVEYNVTVFHY